ncbi:MAG: cation:proton antiporter [Patescibacteria group bacterium]
MKKDIQDQLKSLLFYALEIGALFGILLFLRPRLHEPEIAIPLVAALIPILAFYAHRLEKQFNVPYFVWAIGLGYLFKNEFSLLTQSSETLKILVELFGILIIFGGGLDVKFASFKKLLLPILSLAIIGTLITAGLFSGGLVGFKWLFALPISIGTIALLGAMLSSTDPAAIVPTLKRLKLKNPDDATVAISESAVNDVLGTIMTAVFAVVVIGSGASITSLFDVWSHLFSVAILIVFFKELLIGLVIGYLAYFLLRLWKGSKTMSMASFPFFIGVAFVAYTLSTMWGGSGYLAAFITGLLFDAQQGFKEIEHFFVNLVDGFVKPSVFILLGALISASFWQYAWIGILASLVFILIVRPLSVTLSLGFFAGKNKTFQWRDLLFFDVIRETGVIPAVLLVSYVTLLPDGEIAFAIGSWVILTTLIVLPLVTGWWAKRIKAAR